MAIGNSITQKRDEGIPILIPEESVLEGFIKTKKSFRIESNFYGTLLSTQKVIIDTNSILSGDVICSELIISGTFSGNIFCTGKIECHGNAKITGKVYTKLFQNEDSCDLNCVIQVPNNEIFQTIKDLLLNIDSVSKLSTDATLGKIKELFLTNVYTYSKPAPEGKNGFTSMPAEVEKIAVPEFAH
ncbi:MAG: polymer-forming cytoskeletal protein [Prolixibacteraceae bacterium]